MTWKDDRLNHKQEVTEQKLVFNKVISNSLITSVKRSYVPVKVYMRVEPDDLGANARSAML